MPGTAFFEIALASAASLCSSSQPLQTPCLTSAAISAPKVLAAKPGGEQIQGALHISVLVCEMELLDSTLTIRSSDQGSRHLSCRVAGLPAAQRAAPHHTVTSRTAVHACMAAPSLRDADRSSCATVAAIAQPQGCAGVGSRNGFLVHPAATDASLHLGAVLRLSSASHAATAAGAQPSRVPVSLGACSASTAPGTAGDFLRRSQ